MAEELRQSDCSASALPPYRMSAVKLYPANRAESRLLRFEPMAQSLGEVGADGGEDGADLGFQR